MSVDEEKLIEYKRELEGKKGALREFANKVSSENRNPRYVSTDREVLKIYDSIISRLRSEISELNDIINKINGDMEPESNSRTKSAETYIQRSGAL